MDQAIDIIILRAFAVPDRAYGEGMRVRLPLSEAIKYIDAGLAKRDLKIETPERPLRLRKAVKGADRADD
jgi:hypothetical protein